MFQAKLMLVPALLLALLLPAPGAAAAQPPPNVGGGIDWLQAITDQTNQLVTASTCSFKIGEAGSASSWRRI